MKNSPIRLLLPLLLSAVFVACDSDDSTDSGVSGVTAGNVGEAIDREAILGNVEDVRALIADNAGAIDPALIQDVDYGDGELRVILAESQDVLDTSELEEMCSEISSAIALSDMRIVVEQAGGSESAECEFSA